MAEATAISCPPVLVLAFNRPDTARRVLASLRGHDVDLLVFAGFMLILDAAVVRAYPALNLHPALPGGPVGTWQEVIWRLMDERAAETGVMTQLATEELDRGPTVTYCRFPIRGGAFDALWSGVQGTSLDDIRAGEGVGQVADFIREAGGLASTA